MFSDANTICHRDAIIQCFLSGRVIHVDVRTQCFLSGRVIHVDVRTQCFLSGRVIHVDVRTQIQFENTQEIRCTLYSISIMCLDSDSRFKILYSNLIR